ncbi:hypothetical protein F2Q69_00046903 [Brassica cretica]|uniref:Uncharacterized protein n=1 Tax=Brassica cretica TaxID=69181 RepID=A0A8S9PYE7_BRACR|nr:hypothetical protein F2Q69_00046903 [Brassica cretica]
MKSDLVLRCGRDAGLLRFFIRSETSGGKCSSVVEARLLRYWEAQNVKRGGDLMWVDMLTIDRNCLRTSDDFPTKFRRM